MYVTICTLKVKLDEIDNNFPIEYLNNLYNWWCTCILAYYAIRYTMCHGFRLMKQDFYFWVDFDHFWSENHFFEAAGAVIEIGLSLKPKPHYEF